MAKRKATDMASSSNEYTRRLDELLHDYSVVSADMKELSAALRGARERKKALEAEITEVLNADRRKQYQTTDMTASVELKPFTKQTRITDIMAVDAFMMTIGNSNPDLKLTFLDHLERLKEEKKQVIERLKFKTT